MLLEGLTLLNFNALSGVVSGQSLSNVIGIFFAFSNSSNSSFENAKSFAVDAEISLILN